MSGRGRHTYSHPNAVSYTPRHLTVDVMKCFEKEIILCLRPEDLLKFSTLLADRHLIPLDIKRHVDIMHEDVPHDRRCRYVMLKAYEYLKTKSECMKFLDILNHFPQCGALQSKIKAYGEKDKELLLHAAEGSDIILSGDDLNLIYTCLFNYCYKCDDIARLLISDCNSYRRIKVDFKDSSACLHEVLSTWLSDTRKVPKLSNLVTVVSKVGLGKEAVALQEAVQGSRHSIDEVSNGSMKDVPILAPLLLGPVNEIEEKGTDVAVLLEAMAGDVESEYFQWYRNEEMFEEGSKRIVCISVNDITTEANYTYKYVSHNKRDKESQSVSVQVKTVIDKYKAILTEKYGEEPEVKADTWPVVEQNMFINLAVLSTKDINVECNLIRQSIRGDVDDIFYDKSTTDYRSSFSSIKEGDRILVEGRPGSGKTTLVHKISQDWSRGMIKWKCVRLLFLVHLRGFRSNPSVTLKDIISQYFSCDTDLDVTCICRYAEKRKGLGYCFILDGLDEYQPHVKDTFIYDLIKKKVLSKAVVIVSSRPAAVAEYRKEANKRIEVIGFFKKQILEYIQSYKFSSQCNCSSLISYLSEHPNVHHMCYLPIQSAMICFLYDEDQGLPSTETQIYMEFAKHAILRSLYRSEDKRDTYLKSIHSLTGPDREIFLGICKLAFEKTLSSLQILEQADVDQFCNYLKIGDTFGLIIVDNKATKAGFQNIYTFCHLTFQEFLAACHIFYQRQEKQLEIIKSCASLANMQMVFKFFCGLAKFENDCSLFKALIDSSNFKPLLLVQCAFETQQHHVCDYVTNSLLQFQDIFMTPSDFTALGYVIVNATHNVVRNISFFFSPTEENISAFVKALKGNASSITSLEFRACVKGKLHAINSLLCVIPSLQVLSIGDTEQDIEDIKELGTILKHNELRVLKFCSEVGNEKHKPLHTNHLEELTKLFCSKCVNFRNICFSAKNRESLYMNVKKNLQFFFYSILNERQASYANCDFYTAELLALLLDLQLGSVCTELSLINCNIDSEKAVSLARGLKMNQTLTTLKLTANKIGDEGAIALAECLHLCAIQSLDLSLNMISDEGASALLSRTSKASIKLSLFGNNLSLYNVQNSDGNSMKMLSISGSLGDDGMACVESYFDKEMSLETLHLKSCKNTFKGLESMVSVMSKCTLLLSVTLADCNVDDIGVKLLASSLSHCSRLHTLDLSKNKIGPVGTEELAKALASNSQLEKLDLNENTIDVAGAICLSRCLCSCQKIKYFHLSCNGISDVGAEAVGVIIRSNPLLQSLNLSGNLITDVGACSLADGLKHCVNLVDIDLSRNVIRKYGIIALATSLQRCEVLETLDIGRNNICDGSIVLGQCLKKFVNLINFDVSCNKICKSGAEAIADSLRNCEGLQRLNLGTNEIGNAVTVSLGGTLSRCVKLSELNLSHNSIGNTGVFVFPYLIRHCSKLQSLDLSHNNISSKGIKALGKALVSCTGLCALNLSYNAIDYEGLVALAIALERCCMLQYLGLRNCSISNFTPLHCLKSCDHLSTLELGGNDIEWKPFGSEDDQLSFLKNCVNLNTLILCDIGITNNVAVGLVNALKRCRKLQVLVLNGNNIDGNFLAALASSFATCHNLHTLYLSHVTVNDSNVESVVSYFSNCNLHTLDISYINKQMSNFQFNFLKGCNGLRILNLSHNGICDTDVECLADTFSGLHILDLSHNHLSDDGVKALIQSLSRHLRSLKLDHNLIGNNSVNAIANFLGSCYGIQTLDLSYNKIKCDCIKVLAKSLIRCMHLTFLGLSGSTMSVVDAEALAYALNTCINLESLHLMDISVNTAGALSIAFSLKNLCKLEVLSFGQTCLNDTIIMALAYALKDSCSLKKLSVTSAVTSDKNRSSVNVIRRCVNLKYRDISQEGLRALAASLKSCVNFEFVIWPDFDPGYFPIFKDFGIQVKLKSQEDRNTSFWMHQNIHW